MSTSLRLMLLGIALLLFCLALPNIERGLLLPNIYSQSVSIVDMFAGVVALAGIALVLIGFFKRDR